MGETQNNQRKWQRIEGLARKAMQLYGMIGAGDAVCVGVSGGKDSVALTLALQALSAYHDAPFSVVALTLDPCFGGVETDYSAVAACFAQAGVPYQIRRTNIGPLVFDIRREGNPCALCAKLRRGALHAAAAEMGCNKVALGHHLDDAVETFYMNLLGAGRIGCFSPVTFLSRRQLTVIRPLVLAREYEVAAAVRARRLPVVKSRCPAEGETMRSRTKAFVARRCRMDPAFCQKTLGALQKAGIDGWGAAPPPSGG